MHKFYKQPDFPLVQNWDSVVGEKRGNYIFLLGKYFPIFYASKINLKMSKIVLKLYMLEK